MNNQNFTNNDFNNDNFEEFPSVHLQNYPDFTKIPQPSTPNLVRDMRFVKEICNAGLSIRATNKLNTRLPLQKITIYCKNTGLGNNTSYVDIIKNELNVKVVDFCAEFSDLVKERTLLNLKLCGSKLGKNLSEVVEAVNSGKFVLNQNGTLSACGFLLEEDEFTSDFCLKDKTMEGQYAPLAGWSKTNDKAFVILDITLNEQLITEGRVRDLIRLIQEKRKESGLIVATTANISITTNDLDVLSILQNPSLINEIELKTFSKIAYTKGSTVTGDTITTIKVG